MGHTEALVAFHTRSEMTICSGDGGGGGGKNSGEGHQAPPLINNSTTHGAAPDPFGNNVPLTVHFFADGVGGRGSGDENSERSIVVAAPSPSSLVVNSNERSKTSSVWCSLPTVSSLDALTPLHAPPIVVRLFRDATAAEERELLLASPLKSNNHGSYNNTHKIVAVCDNAAAAASMKSIAASAAAAAASGNAYDNADDADDDCNGGGGCFESASPFGQSNFNSNNTCVNSGNGVGSLIARSLDRCVIPPIPRSGTSTTRTASSSGASISPQSLRLSSSSAGGSRLLLEQWGRVEEAVLLGSEPLGHLRQEGQPTSDNDFPNKNCRIRRTRAERPSWVAPLVASLVATIEEKQRSADATFARSVSEHQQQRKGRGGGGVAAVGNNNNNLARPIVRLKFLCFVPFAVCHPTFSRRLNLVLDPTISTTANGGNGDSYIDEEATTKALRRSEHHHVMKGLGATVPRALMLPPVPTVELTSTSTTGRGKGGTPPALSSSFSAIPHASFVTASPLPIATLESIIDDVGFVIGITPKYGS